LLYRINNNNMSRIGKKLIKIPSNVKIIFDNNYIKVEGQFGKIEKKVLDCVKFNYINSNLLITRINDTKEIKAYHGLYRALVQNMIIGVDKLFTKILITEGVGYKFQFENNVLILHMGYTHPVKFEIPNGIDIKLESLTKLVIKGVDKEIVGLFAAKIRDIRPPEPYKGKGILYENEKIRRKVGKK
jgi:large subunit ribosomal protein L6